tara:strand:- start:1274 stop:1849 length:576 start_codon:yes stop_codon:yes gene_type:complete
MLFEQGNYKGHINRRLPNKDDMRKWLSNIETMKELDDFNIILTGSFPSEDANDIDIVFQGPLGTDFDEVDTKDIENVFTKGLEYGWDNDILVDMNVSFDQIRDITNDMQYYIDSGGDRKQNISLVYGPHTIIDGEVMKDVSHFKSISDNLFIKRGYTPSIKQLWSYINDKDGFYRKYKNKPIVIKNRKKVY